MPPRAAARITCLAGLLLAACATSGQPFDVDGVTEIERGVTTESDVRDMFGAPIYLRSSGGGSTWRYEFTEERSADTGTATRIGSLIASIFLGRSMNSPVNVAYRNQIEHQLQVWFDADGVVEDFSYERLERPSKRIY